VCRSSDAGIGEPSTRSGGRKKRPSPDPEQSRQRQQRDLMTGGAIDLYEVAEPEILDPRGVEGQHSRASDVPGKPHRVWLRQYRRSLS
jgi:hypothetical protein